MAQDKDMTLETTKKGKKTSKKKTILILFAVLFLVSAAGGGYVVYLKNTPEQIPSSELPVEIISFAFKNHPDLYQAILDLDEEITYTQNEIDRIGNVGKTYPDQQKIAETEKKAWTANLSSLTKCRIDFEKQLKALYVTYRVNPETGQAMIDEKKEALTTMVEQVVTQSKTLTDKLRAIEDAKGFIEKFTDKLKS